MEVCVEGCCSRRRNYTYQERQGGIAEALGLAEHFASGEPIHPPPTSRDTLRPQEGEAGVCYTTPPQ